MKVVIIGIVEKLHPLSFLIWRMLQQHLLLVNVHCVIYLMTALVISGTHLLHKYRSISFLVSVKVWNFDMLRCYCVHLYVNLGFIARCFLTFLIIC